MELNEYTTDESEDVIVKEPIKRRRNSLIKKTSSDGGTKTITSKLNPLYYLSTLLELRQRFGLRQIIECLGLLLIIFSLFPNLNSCSEYRAINNTADNVELISRICGVVVDELKKEKIAKEIKHDEGMTIRKNVDPEIRNLLMRLILELKCDRAFVIEAHNGTENTSGLQFRFGEMSYEEISNNTYAVSESYERINLSRYSFFTYMEDNRAYIGDMKKFKKIDNKLASKMIENDVKYLACQLIEGRDKPVGIIGITFTKVGRRDDDEISSKVSQYGGRIAAYLNSYRE